MAVGVVCVIVSAGACIVAGVVIGAGTGAAQYTVTTAPEARTFEDGAYAGTLGGALGGVGVGVGLGVNRFLGGVAAKQAAAKAVPETLNFGSRAAAREGLPGDLAAVGNRFFRGATSKSQDFQAIGLPGGGYRLQFFSPANNPGYGKVYVQQIDSGGNIISRYKDTIGPDGFIERKFVQ